MLRQSRHRNKVVELVPKAVYTIHNRWHRGAVGRVSDLRSRGRGFESRLGTWRRNSMQVFHTYVPLSPSSTSWYQPKAVMPCGWEVKAGMVRM